MVTDDVVDEPLPRRVVVGIRDADHDRSALGWSLVEAGKRGVDLHVVHTWRRPFDVAPTGVPGPASDLRPYQAVAEQLIDEAIATLPPSVANRDTKVHRAAIEGHPSQVLLDYGIHSDLLVLGTRGRGAVRGLLGSVSHQCVHHAVCPVAVVPPGWPIAHGPARIAVGVDGSAGSKLALRWAMQEAGRWEAELVVVHAWDTPFAVEPYGMAVTPRDQAVFEERARELIRAMVESEVRAGIARPAVIASPRANASGPALVDVSATVDLVVVGSRGRGGFSALFVGSTSLQCLHHAACPVVVVPTGAAR